MSEYAQLVPSSNEHFNDGQEWREEIGRIWVEDEEEEDEEEEDEEEEDVLVMDVLYSDLDVFVSMELNEFFEEVLVPILPLLPTTPCAFITWSILF
jgi:hypothetical protein